MYKYCAILTLEQLSRTTMTDSDNGIKVINSNTFNAQIVGVTEINIPPVNPRYIALYPTCKNFIEGNGLVLKIYHIQSHDVVSVRRVSSGCNVLTNITTSHVPKFSTKTIPPDNKLDVSVDSIEDVRAKYCSDPIPYVPGDICPSDVVIADPITSFSSVAYWLSTPDGTKYTTLHSYPVAQLVSKCCNSSGMLETDDGDELKTGNLARSHLLMKPVEQLFDAVRVWPKPTGVVGVINGIRVEYNNAKTPELISLFIKKDWRELGAYMA